MDRQFDLDNAAGLARLRAVVTGLGADDLATPMPAGWTPASVLCHMAFFDRRAAAIVRRAAEEGARPSGMDPDLVNEAMRPFLLAVPPDKAVSLALASAEEAASTVAAATDDLLASIEAVDDSFWKGRSRHWHKHLDDIERAVAAAHRAPRL